MGKPPYFNEQHYNTSWAILQEKEDEISKHLHFVHKQRAKKKKSRKKRRMKGKKERKKSQQSQKKY